MPSIPPSTKEGVVDIVYLLIASALWLAIYGLARACAALQPTGGRK